MIAPRNTRCQATGCCNLLGPQAWNGRAQQWCSPRCRKSQYAPGPCPDCGAPRAYQGRHTDRCLSCARDHVHERGERRIIEAMREWHAVTGRVPGAVDWNPSHPKHRPLPATSYRDWPWVTCVMQIFGSWNAAVEAAGFEAMTVGQRRDPEAHIAALRAALGTDDRRTRIAAMYATGLTLAQIGDRMGVTAGTVTEHLARMRRDGWDLPYRQAPREKTAT